MDLPRRTALRQDDTHRLIPSRYSEESVLAPLAGSQKELHDLFELEGATNDRLLAEDGRLPGISVHELVFGIPLFRIVNAAFTHARPGGTRFSSGERGAWYAGFELETSQVEVAFHKGEELKEINWQEPEIFTFDDYLADFRGEFHDIRKGRKFAACLAADSYGASQKLGRELLAQGSVGVVYPSVRRRGGTCIACFRPALVSNVRKGDTTTIEFAHADAQPVIHVKRRRRAPASRPQ